jgi:hypothetical protein
MVEGGYRLGFSNEKVLAIRIGYKLGREDFKGDFSVLGDIYRSVNDPLAATADFCQDFVM